MLVLVNSICMLCFLMCSMVFRFSLGLVVEI